MLLSGRHAGELTELVQKLRLKFAIKDLSLARHILGIAIDDRFFCLKLTTLDVS